jgi:hypothetical protein
MQWTTWFSKIDLHQGVYLERSSLRVSVVKIPLGVIGVDGVITPLNMACVQVT